MSNGCEQYVLLTPLLFMPEHGSTIACCCTPCMAFPSSRILNSLPRPMYTAAGDNVGVIRALLHNLFFACHLHLIGQEQSVIYSRTVHCVPWLLHCDILRSHREERPGSTLANPAQSLQGAQSGVPRALTQSPRAAEAATAAASMGAAVAAEAAAGAGVEGRAPRSCNTTCHMHATVCWKSSMHSRKLQGNFRCTERLGGQIRTLEDTSRSKLGAYLLSFDLQQAGQLATACNVKRPGKC